MTRHVNPLAIATCVACFIGLFASAMIGLTPVVHGGVPLAIYAGGLMLMSIACGIILDRRRLAHARA